MKKLYFLLAPFFLSAQGYTSYFTGNPTNIQTSPEYGICMMGGATEHDNAMIWLLEKANGGDVVVLRSSGSDGYNDYLYAELGVNVNSVETLVITSVAGATNPYVLDKVANAEMIWFAGGDQYNYVSFFKDNALEDLINDHINVKRAPIGGTSAGMAILGGRYFSAQNGSISSSQALNNPFHPNLTLGSDDFLQVPRMDWVTTDTHFDNPDRRGRLLTFLARTATDNGVRSYGIACNEYVAVCIDEDGMATVYGEYPEYQEFAFFLQANCQETFGPETVVAGSPLTWNRGGEAVKVYRVPGTMQGTNWFDLADWQTGSGGDWQHWTATNGTFASAVGTASTCELATDSFSVSDISLTPNPFSDKISLQNVDAAKVSVFDMNGKKVFSENSVSGEIFTDKLSPGTYLIKVEQAGKTSTRKMIKR